MSSNSSNWSAGIHLATRVTVSLTPARLSMLLERIDWRRPVRSHDLQLAVSLNNWPIKKKRIVAQDEQLASRDAEIGHLKLLIVQASSHAVRLSSEELDRQIQQLELRLGELEESRTKKSPAEKQPQRKGRSRFWPCAGLVVLRSSAYVSPGRNLPREKARSWIARYRRSGFVEQAVGVTIVQPDRLTDGFQEEGYATVQT